MKKLDICLIAAALLAAALLAAFFYWRGAQPSARVYAEVYVDGELTRRLDLPDEPRELEIQGVGGRNVLLLEPDGVRMLEADCASRDCVRHPKITRPGSVIACLPHRVLIRLGGEPDEDEGGVDIIVG